SLCRTALPVERSLLRRSWLRRDPKPSKLGSTKACAEQHFPSSGACSAAPGFVASPSRASSALQKPVPSSTSRRAVLAPLLLASSRPQAEQAPLYKSLCRAALPVERSLLRCSWLRRDPKPSKLGSTKACAEQRFR